MGWRAGGSTVTARAGSYGASHEQRGLPRTLVRTPCATRSSPPHSTPAYHFATCKKPPATPTREPRCATTEDANPSTVTPPTSSRPSSPAPPAKRPECLARALCVRTGARYRQFGASCGPAVDRSSASERGIAPNDPDLLCRSEWRDPGSTTSRGIALSECWSGSVVRVHVDGHSVRSLATRPECNEFHAGVSI